MNAAREYTTAIGDKLSSALESKNLELGDLQLLPSGKKFVIRGTVIRVIANQSKIFAVEVDGNLKRLNTANIDGFVDYIVPKIVAAFYEDDSANLVIC